MIELMDGFYIYTAMSPAFISLRHQCSIVQGRSRAYAWGYHVNIDSNRCPNCKTPLTEKVVVMYKLWELNQ